MTADTLAAVPSPSGYAGATLDLDVDQVEHQRRQDAGIGSILGNGFGGLNHLMALPAGLPVPIADLTEQQRAYVKAAPAGICTVTRGLVTRDAIRPCRVALATVRFRHAGRLALDSASRFAPFCARQVVIERYPRMPHPDVTLLDFAFYGIGVVLEQPDGALETLVEPRPWRPQRHTPAAWWFAETAYRQYLDTCVAEVSR
jgi:hypothetical protein